MGKKFLAEVETDEYYNIEIKSLSKLDYISKDIIRKIIKELSNQNYNNYELSVALRKSLEKLLEE